MNKRIRRVKCDEGRPECLRCVKIGLDCDGYMDQSKELKKPFRLIAKQSVPVLRDGIVLGFGINPTFRPMCRSPSNSMFKNEEFRYFKLFSNQIAEQLSQQFDSNLWNHLVLQACESNSSVRHAAIAIGALDLNTWKTLAKSPDEKARRGFAYHEVN